MNWNQLLFDIFPFVALTLAVGGTVLRWRAQPSTVSSLSSQLLERRKLYWGSVAFHWGITILLLAHLVVLILPRGVERWNQVPARLYALEMTGLALGVWTFVGLGILIFRRLSEPKVKAVTSRMDLVLLAVLALQVVTGLWIALGYRFGSQWAPAVFVPYIRSLLSLQPRSDLIAALPWVLRLHAFTFFVLLALFPFSRLVHIISLPLGYLTRPWQIVLRIRPRSVASPRLNRGRKLGVARVGDSQYGSVPCGHPLPGGGKPLLYILKLTTTDSETTRLRRQAELLWPLPRVVVSCS